MAGHASSPHLSSCTIFVLNQKFMARFRDTRKSTTMQSHSQRSNVGKLISEDLVIARSEALSEEATQTRSHTVPEHTRKHISLCVSYFWPSSRGIEQLMCISVRSSISYLVRLSSGARRRRNGKWSRDVRLARMRSLYLI